MTHRSETAAETFQPPLGLPVSATCAGEAPPSPAPFQSSKRKVMMDLSKIQDETERQAWLTLTCDLIGCVCLFVILFAGLWIGAVFQ